VKQNINCPCGKIFQIEVPDEIDLDKEPEYFDKISEGSFLSFKCPDCGKKHKPEYKLTIVWKSKKLKMEVLTELERGEFYRRKKEDKSVETIIGYPEMADRLAVIKDDLDPTVIETLKYYLLAKAEETYPNKEINAWYHCNGPTGIEFHLDGIRDDEVAVMRVPLQLYEKTLEDFKKHPKNDVFASMRCLSYTSVQNMFRPDVYR
jgi:hypothetical protein